MRRCNPMPHDRPTEAGYVLISDVWQVERQPARSPRFECDEELADPWSYCAKRGRGTIRLTLVEYRILRFLATRPNQALTRQRIAQAISTASHYVSAENLG